MGHFLPFQWLYPVKKECVAAGKESNNCLGDDNDYNKCQYQKEKGSINNLIEEIIMLCDT